MPRINTITTHNASNVAPKEDHLCDYESGCIYVAD